MSKKYDRILNKKDGTGSIAYRGDHKMKQRKGYIKRNIESCANTDGPWHPSQNKYRTRDLRKDTLSKMVWWMHYNPGRRREGVFFGVHSEKDVVCETVNIMFDCQDASYDGFDIYYLVKAGVNIFNVDMTQHDSEFFVKVKNAVESSQSILQTLPSTYYTPIGLSVTMSAENPIDVDDRVDIIILKDITTTEQLRQFKKQNNKFSAIPILLWPPTLKIADLNELIMISGGIVMDTKLSNIVCDFRHVLKKCKEERKPIFFLHPNILENYYEDTSNDRVLFVQVRELIKHRLDGIIVKHRGGGRPPIEFLQTFIKATEVIEKRFHNVASDYFKMSFSMKIPVLQPYATALAASLAALQSEASAILVFTTTGTSAKILSCALPPCYVIAITRYEKAARRMHLFRKIIPLLYKEKRFGCWQEESKARIAFGTQFGLKTGLFNVVAKLVVLAPSEEEVMYCNSFQITTAGQCLDLFKCGVDNN